MILPKIDSDFKEINRFEDVEEDIYFNQKDYINSSALKHMLKSPATFIAQYNAKFRIETKDMKIGKMLHMAVLEPERFKKNFTTTHLYSYDPKIRESFHEKEKSRVSFGTRMKSGYKGIEIVKDEDFYLIQSMRDAVFAHPGVKKLLGSSSAFVEKPGYFRDAETNLLARFKPDYFDVEKGILLDLKTTIDCTSKEFARSIHKYNYALQAAFYKKGIEEITHKKVNYVVFLAIEKKAPFECAIYLADDAMLEKGLQDYMWCMAKLKHCIEKNEWPRYQDKLEPISLPSYALNNWEEKMLVKNEPGLSKAGNLKQLLANSKKEIEAALPKHITPERMMRIALTEARKTPALLDCNQASFLGAIIQAAQLGLEPGGALGHCWLIPYSREVQFQLGYRGMLDLAMRSGKVAKIIPRAVREGDLFEYEYGLNEQLKHVPKMSERADLTHVYAVIFLKDGNQLFDVMSKEEVDIVRKNSKTGNSPAWREHFEAMALKTVIRRIFKYTPVSVEMQKAVGLDEAAEAGISQRNAAFVESELKETISKAEELHNLISPQVKSEELKQIDAMDGSEDVELSFDEFKGK